MPIKFACPHCKRGLSVKEHLAGKRGACPACKKPVVIPTLAAAPPAPVDIEAAAAAALADEPKSAPVEQDNRTIDFTCPYCDAPIKVAIALGGKNAPCPECRHIVKVPMPEQKGPKDWRKADPKIPLGAKREELEGAWGSATSAGAVSRQALVEAEAIPSAVEPVSRRKWFVRGVVAAVIVCVVGGLTLLAFSIRTHTREEKALALALDAVAGEKAKGHEAMAGEVHRGAGEFLARQDKAADAQRQFNEARGLFLKLPARSEAEASDRDLLLLDLALTELDLGGEADAARRGTRLKWDDVQKGLNRTLGGIRSPQARLEAVRLLSRKALALGKGEVGLAAANHACVGDDQYVAKAEVGLQMVRAGQKDVAAIQAESANQMFNLPTDAQAKAEKGKPAVRKAPPPTLIALWMALGNMKEAEKLGANEKIPEKLKITPPEVAAGYAIGLAWQGPDQAKQALEMVQKMTPSLARLEAVAGITTAMAENAHPEAGRLIAEAVPLVEKDAPFAYREAANSPRKDVVGWLVLRVVRAGAEAGASQESLKKLAAAAVLRDAALRGRAELEILRAQLKATKGQVETSTVNEMDKSVLSYALALEAIARHNARHGGGDPKSVAAWPEEASHPFGYIGLALGAQDK